MAISFLNGAEVRLCNYEVIEHLDDKAPFDNKKVTPMAAPGPAIPSGVWATGAPILWGQDIKGFGCKIGVVDTGIDDSHPELQGRVLFRRDYVSDGASPSTFNMHGTHVAGTIAARGPRLRGVAPSASLVDYRVLGKNGEGTNANVATAIIDAANDGCNIITMSLGSSYDDSALHEAVRYAVGKGSLVVVAVGNEGPDTISYPGYYSEVVGVAAVEFLGKQADPQVITVDFSSTNIEVDVCADGYHVLSCVPGGGYAVLDGTSMATPHVTGVAALLYDKAMQKRGARLTEADLFLLLQTLAVDVHTINKDNQTGVGFVTFYPQIPSISSGSTWELPTMRFGSP